MTRRGNKLRLQPQLQACLTGALIVLIALCGTAALSAFLISRGWLPHSFTRVAAPLAVLLAALLGPLPLQRSLGRRPLPAAFAFLAGLLAVLALCRLLFWPDGTFGGWAVPAAAIVGATCAGLLGSRRPRRRH